MGKRVTAVIVAAGSSSRMGFDKLSWDLGGRTVLEQSLQVFDKHLLITDLVVVYGKNQENAEKAAQGCRKPVTLVAGGNTRAQSVKNGVSAAGGELVAIHDAARPFVSEQVITQALEAAEKTGAAAPAVPFCTESRLPSVLTGPSTYRLWKSWTRTRQKQSPTIAAFWNWPDSPSP